MLTDELTRIMLDELVIVAMHVVFPQKVINAKVEQMLLDYAFQLCNYDVLH